MVRSAAAFLAVLILPAFALAQEPGGSHTVVRDDTLWDLAERYYDNPFEWRQIWEANRGVIMDPNLIYPAQVLTIPGLATADRGGAVGPGGDRPIEVPAPDRGTPQAQGGTEGPLMPGEIRTIFYRDEMSAAAVIAQANTEYVPVDIDQVLAAPWLTSSEATPVSVGALEGFALDTDRGSTVRQFHQVRISTSAPVRVGDELQIFRKTRSISRVGTVWSPTGVLSVLALADSGAVGVVTKEYGRIQPGDFVGPLPEYDLEVGVYPRRVEGGEAAMIMGFSRPAQVPDIGHHAFLDLGADDGVRIGDEFVLFSDAVSDDPRGALQVIAVTPDRATARIASMKDDVFAQGVVVRLTRQMP